MKDIIKYNHHGMNPTPYTLWTDTILINVYPWQSGNWKVLWIVISFMSWIWVSWEWLIGGEWGLCWIESLFNVLVCLLLDYGWYHVFAVDGSHDTPEHDALCAFPNPILCLSKLTNHSTTTIINNNINKQRIKNSIRTNPIPTQLTLNLQIRLQNHEIR